MKAVVIEVRKSQWFGKVGRVVATCESYQHAEMFVANIEANNHIAISSPELIGYIAANIGSIDKACQDEGIHLRD